VSIEKLSVGISFTLSRMASKVLSPLAFAESLLSVATVSAPSLTLSPSGFAPLLLLQDNSPKNSSPNQTIFVTFALFYRINARMKKR
jgi:hypothetical protein